MPRAREVRRSVLVSDAVVQNRASEMYEHGSYDLPANARAMVIAGVDETIDAALKEMLHRLLDAGIEKHVVYRSSKKVRR